MNDNPLHKVGPQVSATSDVPDLSSEEAGALVADIRSSFESAWDHYANGCTQLLEAYEGRAWIALDLDGWSAFVRHTLDVEHLRIPKAEREGIVQALTDGGLSVREVATATGLGKSTVWRMLQPGVPDGTPDEDDAPEGFDDWGHLAKAKWFADSAEESYLAIAEAITEARTEGLRDSEIARQLNVDEDWIEELLAASIGDRDFFNLRPPHRVSGLSLSEALQQALQQRDVGLWEVADSLLAEVGRSSKPGAEDGLGERFVACADELAKDGMDYTPNELAVMRDTAQAFSPSERVDGVSYFVHEQVRSNPTVLVKLVEDHGQVTVAMARRSATLPPGRSHSHKKR
jgi:transposase